MEGRWKGAQGQCECMAPSPTVSNHESQRKLIIDVANRQSLGIRLEKHLEGCEVCQAELAAMEVYDSMIESVHSTPMPKIDWVCPTGTLLTGMMVRVMTFQSSRV